MNYKKYILFLSLPLVALLVDFNQPEERLEVSLKKSELKKDDAAFDTMMKVLTHKRCMNCHPSGDKPRQGEDSHFHNFGVKRGPDDHGHPAAKCSTCHQSKNNDNSGVPGAPHWGLAPLSMAWEGKSRVEIAKLILDKSRNGNKSVKEIEKHLTEDDLVLWAFEPGINANKEEREKPPISKGDFIVAVKTWIADGAQIPEE